MRYDSDMDIQSGISNFLNFLNNSIVPFLLALAGVIFLWNVTRYFIFQGDSEEGQTKARSLALWSIIAFVIMVSMWGIVNLIVDGIGIDGRSITPDYICDKQSSTGCGDYIQDLDATPNYNAV